MKSYKFKIKASKRVQIKIEQTLDLCRELYNSAIQERRDAWKINKISINYHDQRGQLPQIKILRPEFKDIYSQILQDVLRRVSATFDGFFARVKRGEKAGFPRFKGENLYSSFCYAQTGFQLDGDKLILSKIGSVRIRQSRKMFGKIKTCIIKREVSGWFAIFTVEDEPEKLPKTNKQIGVDAGIEYFLTLSDGTQIENFKYLEKAQKQLRRAQRKVARRVKGSNSRRKAVLKLRKIHQKVKNQRNDFSHKVSTLLVKNFDLIAIEKLNILGMSRGFLSKQIHDAAWNSFFQKLIYKAEYAGRQLIKVNPNGTSQVCICGTPVKKDLSVRIHLCDHCGLSEHRDIVSAKVILKRAVGQTVEVLTWAA